MLDQRVYVRFPEEADAEQLTAMFKRNREFFEKFSPTNPDEFYTEEQQLQIIKRASPTERRTGNMTS